MTEPSGFLDRTLRINGTTPNGETHGGEIAHIAHTRIDDQAAAAARFGRRRQQIAEVTVFTRTGRSGDKQIAFAQLFDRHVHHPIVAWRHQHGDRRAGDARTAVDRAQTGMHQACAALRFMHGGNAGVRQAADHVCICTFDTGYYDRHI